ncbi:armadillo repeat-containing protein 12-like [Heteronotia binoei]|uniref:armadillo repeat-containing protein 12-like n=1 Tax=Heteronotia binoei TaxID=13085 RepID=UPI00292D3A5D|nr:armadillo repeat-containing protein 12-like [Heteronotia binoei]
MNYCELITVKNVVTAATGAGAIYLLGKTLLEAFRSPSFKSEPRHLSRFSVKYRSDPFARASVPGELRRTLQSLTPNLDGSSKKAALHTIIQCIFLKESEASSCSYDDIKLVASFLDDPDNAVKTEALNALKAFTSIWKFKIKIQEYIPKITELVVRNRDGNLQAAGLRLMNGLDISNRAYIILKRLLPDFMDILLMADTSAKVQVLKLLSTMAQKEDLLYDILNSQAKPEFLSLFQPSLPENLLYEMLVFVEQLNERRLAPEYQSIHWQYNNLSLHNIIFGENSRLSDRLIALIIHPEEEVQVQACKVVFSLHLNKEESKVIGSISLGADISIHPIDSALCNPPFSPIITSSPTINNVIFDVPIVDVPSGGHLSDDAGQNVQPSPATSNVIVDAPSGGHPPDDAGQNIQPSPATSNAIVDAPSGGHPPDDAGQNVQPSPATSNVIVDAPSGGHPPDDAGQNVQPSPAASNVIVDAPSGGLPPDDASQNFQPLQVTNDTSQTFQPLQSTGDNVQAVNSSSVSSHTVDNTINSSPVLAEPTDAFQPIATAYSDEDSDNT